MVVMYALIGVLELDVLYSRSRGNVIMNMNLLMLYILGGYIIIAVIVIIVWIFVNPEDDLCDICGCGLLWPAALLLLIVFVPFKLLEMLQNKLLERRAKKKYYNEDEYRSENEDWYNKE